MPNLDPSEKNFLDPRMCNVILETFLLAGEKRADCFTLMVSMLACGCLCFVPLSLGALSWSVMRNCDISWSYSLIFLSF